MNMARVRVNNQAAPRVSCQGVTTAGKHMKIIGKLAILAGTGLLFGTGFGLGMPTAQAGTHVSIQVGIAPPPPRWEPIPAPRAGFFWVPGYWMWVSGGYRWHAGRWHRHRPGYTYMRPAWYRSGRTWRFRSGYWHPARHRVVIHPSRRHHAPRNRHWRPHHRAPRHGHWRSRGHHRGHR